MPAPTLSGSSFNNLNLKLKALERRGTRGRDHYKGPTCNYQSQVSGRDCHVHVEDNGPQAECKTAHHFISLLLEPQTTGPTGPATKLNKNCLSMAGERVCVHVYVWEGGGRALWQAGVAADRKHRRKMPSGIS